MNEVSEGELERLRVSICAVLKMNASLVRALTRASTDLRAETVQIFQQGRAECQDHEIGRCWDRELETFGGEAMPADVGTYEALMPNTQFRPAQLVT
jgi:hypothetical protein